MFEYLYGTVEYKKMDYIAIDINGIGYRVYFPLREYEKIEVGNKYKFYIYNHIKEDTYKLIGFLEEGDRKIFELLLKINGIGSSLALAVLSISFLLYPKPSNAKIKSSNISTETVSSSV